MKFSEDLEASCIVAANVNAKDRSIILSDLKEATRSDPEDQAVFLKVQNKSFADTKKEEEDLVKPYYHVKDRLCISDDLLMYSFDGGDLRLIIPYNLRPQILRNLHSAHQGVDSITKRARQSSYWPGMGKDIEQLCSSCTSCMERIPSLTKEELIASPVPEYPFEQVASDLFCVNGHHYLIYVDRYTGWIEIAYFKNTPNSNDIETLRDRFHHFGAPTELSIDGGPNISSMEIQSFLKNWCIW